MRAADLELPLTEISSGATPAVKAACSSAAPNVSQPAPSSLWILRRTREWLALIEGMTSTVPSVQPRWNSFWKARTLRRSCGADMT